MWHGKSNHSLCSSYPIFLKHIPHLWVENIKIPIQENPTKKLVFTQDEEPQG